MKVTPRPSAGRLLDSLIWFENVQLTGVDLYYPNVLLKTGNLLIQPLLETVQSTGVSTTDMKEFDVSGCIANRRGEMVFFFIYNTDNYFHFLYDALPQLSQYLRLREGDYPKLKLLMNPRKEYRFVSESLALLGIKLSDIILPNAYTIYDAVIVASSPTHEGSSNDPPRSEIWDIYSRMAKASTPIETPKKIYVSRRSWLHGDTSNIGSNYTTRRRMIAEDALVERLGNLGYTEVFCENLSMSDKIQYFANATHVVGAIGGGMCNLVFSPSTVRVVCIASLEFERINRRFLYTMEHTQLTIFRNTWTTSSLYRRVKVGNIIGEVIEERGNDLVLAVSNGVTWTEGDITSTYIVPKDDAEFLDKGLNSPWNFDVNECVKMINE